VLYPDIKVPDVKNNTGKKLANYWMRRSVVTRPKVKRAEQEKCDSRRFAIIRGGFSLVSAESQPPLHR